ncbi:MAG: ATP-binding protein [Clostridiales bacterium]|nr:ATP-binding protein [Clostridiales bacterium]
MEPIKKDGIYELKVDALAENLARVTDFVNERLEGTDCSMRVMMQIDVAVEEIFINIANYAYGQDKGDAIIRLEIKEEPFTASITFIDRGTPYDPLAKEDPDVTLAAADRPIGGLGIYMTKKIMDDVLYEYKDGSNILKLIKRL